MRLLRSGPVDYYKANSIAILHLYVVQSYPTYALSVSLPLFFLPLSI